MINRDISRSTTKPVRPVVARHFIAAFAFFLLAAIGFSVIAHQIREGATLPFDRAVLLAIHEHAPASLSPAVIALTEVGGPVGTVAMTGTLAVLLWVRRRKFAAITIVASVGGAAVMNLVLKSLFERARPDLWERLVHEVSFSFPSGHAMVSSALALSLMMILWRTKWRWLTVGLAGLYMFLIGFTRLYLGVHYPTDVIGGWLVSLGWVSVVAALISRYIDRRQHLNNAA